MAEYTTSDGVAVERPPEDDFTRPTQELDPEELLLRVKAWFHEDEDHCRKWHQTAKEEFAFRAGDQWRQEDKDAKRPQLVFNQVDAVIDAVIGSEIVNRQEVRYIPRQVEDGPANEVFSEAARWFRDQCDAEHEDSAAFADAATVGMGWTDTTLNYEDNPDGDPKVEKIDPREMFWDTSNIKPNLTAARRLYRVRQDVPIEECKAKWPKLAGGKEVYDDSCYDATWANGSDTETTPHDATRPRSHKNDNPAEEGIKPRTVTLVEVQWWEREPYYRAVTMDPMTGQPSMMELTEEEHEAAQSRSEELGIPYRGIEQIRKCYYRAFLGDEVLEIQKMVAPSGKRAVNFSLVPVTGKLDQSTGHFYGLVRNMRGPQEYANKWVSTTVEIMARGAKGGLLIEEGAVADTVEFEKDWAKPGGNSYVKPGANTSGKIQPKPATQFPADFMQMTQFAISSIRDATGVNKEILGRAEQEQAASLEYQRRQSATTILSPLFDSLKRYRRIQGRVLLYLITEFLSDSRLIRITGEFGDQYVPLTKQPGTVEYDVIVDDAPSSPSQKEMVWASLVQVAPLLTKLAVPPEAYMAMLDYGPFPSSVAQKIKQAVAKQAQQPAPPTPAQLKQEEMKVEMEMKAQGQQAEMAMKAQEQASDQEFKKQESASKIEMMWAELQAKLIMKEKELEADMQRENIRAMNTLAIEGQRAQNDAQMQRRQQGFEQGMAREDQAHQHELARDQADNDMEIEQKTAKFKQGLEAKKQNKEKKAAKEQKNDDVLKALAQTSMSLTKAIETVSKASELALKPRKTSIKRDPKTGEKYGESTIMN